MSGDAMCSCGHVESAHRKMTDPACLAPTGYAFGAFSFGCSCATFEAVSPGDEFRGPRNTIEESDELHDSPMFSAAVKESGSRTCVNPGLSPQIVSTPIVSTTVMPLAPLPRPQVTTSGALSASALRSAPIPGYIADGDTAKMSRPDKIRAVAQQAHDDGDCVCCLPDPDTITITISREDAVKVQGTSGACDTLDCGVGYCIFVRACLAALKGER